MAAIDYDAFRHYSYEDYKEWEGRWELIDGIPYAMAPAPYPEHQRLVARIWKELDANLECSDKRCEVYLSPVDWKIDEATVVQPDVEIFCERPTGQYFSQTPPLVVEVLSKATMLKDLTTKKELYRRAGVKYYLITDPESRTAKLYELDGENYRTIAHCDRESRCEFDLRKNCRSAIDFTRVFN